MQPASFTYDSLRLELMIGLFRYFNAYPYRRLLATTPWPVRVYDTPKGVVTAWRAGKLDAALLPVGALRNLHYCLNWGIASQGPVWSVGLASHHPPQRWQAIIIDPASTSSVRLLSWLMRQGHLPLLPLATHWPSSYVAYLVIGDNTLQVQRLYETFLDLGSLLTRKRAFPYAIWWAKPPWQNRLRRLWAQTWPLLTWSEEAYPPSPLQPEQLHTYWTQAIQYRFRRHEMRYWLRKLSKHRTAGFSLPLTYARS